MQATVHEDVLADLDTAARQFLALRPRLMEIAFRILRSANESEDVVQEAWMRWQATDRRVVVNPAAFLATTTTRLALNLNQSARHRHETAAEPVALDTADPFAGPQGAVERTDAIEQALLLVLQRLSPSERASFVLREAFDYPYEDIARIVGRTPVNARQLVRRSHKRIGSDRTRAVTSAAHRRLLQGFRAAADAGNFSVLEQVFASDLSG